jgi:hypothetical protein
VSAARQAALADRKALLATRAEFDRQRVMLAVHEIKAIVVPSSVADRAETARPLAGVLVSLMGPLVGARRLRRWLRVASFLLVAGRVARNWRDVRR